MGHALSGPHDPRSLSLGGGWEQVEWNEEQASSWLRSSQLAIRQLEPDASGYWRPAWLPRMLAWAVILLGCYLSFVLFW